MYPILDSLTLCTDDRTLFRLWRVRPSAAMVRTNSFSFRRGGAFLAGWRDVLQPCMHVRFLWKGRDVVLMS